MDSPAPLWARWTAATTAGEALGFAVPAAVGAAAFGLGVPDGATVPLASPPEQGRVSSPAQHSRSCSAGSSRAFDPATGSAPPRPPRHSAGAWGCRSASSPTGSPPPWSWPAGRWPPPLLLTAIGTAQWLVLRRHVAGAGLWVPANAAAWLVGLPLPFAALALVGEDDPAGVVLAAGVVAGLGMGLVVAAVTGLALVRLLRDGSQPASAP